MIDKENLAQRVKTTNSKENWEEIWKREGDTTWRTRTLKNVYDHIIDLIETNSTVLDVGGSIGALANRLKVEKSCTCTVAEHSEEALKLVAEKGINTLLLDLNSDYSLPEFDYIVSCEVCEHLNDTSRAKLFNEIKLKAKKGVLLSVPNNRLGPEEESQHFLKYTELSFRKELQQYFDHVYVTELGPFLLATCGELATNSDTRKEKRLASTDLWSHVWEQEGKEAWVAEALRRANLYIEQIRTLQFPESNVLNFVKDGPSVPLKDFTLLPSKELFILIPNNEGSNPVTAVELKRIASSHFEHSYVSVFGPILLAVCGQVAKKDFKLSVTMPIRDESADIEATLASFRCVADQMVIGVDPRTKDNTYEIASLYADEVFYLENPEGIPGTDEYQGEGKVHFSYCRNQCLDRCTGDWVFMSEGHERLYSGEYILRHLSTYIPEQAQIGFVFRRGNNQQWAYPWLFKNRPDFRFTRPVHNILDYPEGTFCIKLPQVITLHERDHKRAAERAKQRETQNRITLLNDWLIKGSEASLFYVAQEWREISVEKAVERFEQFLIISKNGAQRYQARLMLAKEYMDKFCQKEDMVWWKKAKEVLLVAVADDWSRSDHWIWLGDLCFMNQEFEQAYRFYSYATLMIGEPPFTMWWIDLTYYGYLPAQRMAMVCAELGRYEESLAWGKKVLDLLPPDSPNALFEEAETNIKLLEDFLSTNEQEEVTPIEMKEFGTEED